jgi:hypothetical protein
MAEEKKLEVGDVFFVSYKNEFITRYVVDRVTAKYACVVTECGEILYDRIRLERRGRDRSIWSYEHAERWSQDLQNLYEAQQAMRVRKALSGKLANEKLTLTKDQVHRIKMIIEEQAKEE